MDNKLQLFLKSLTLQQLRDFEVICSGGELPVPGHYDFFVAVVTEKNNRNNTMPAVYVTVWDDVGEVLIPYPRSSVLPVAASMRS